MFCLSPKAILVYNKKVKRESMAEGKIITKPFPRAPKLGRLIGPSFLILALGLGSGEIILWPYLVANYGLGLAWGALFGLTFQYFINLEIERYALVKGESVFVGFRRLSAWLPTWFIASTFIGFGLPGIVAASAQLFAYFFGLSNFKYLAIGLLLLIGVILSVGKTVYGLLEKFTQVVIILGVPFILLLTIYLSRWHDVGTLLSGLVGRGQGFWFLPTGISLATFLAAFAYSGAGGNLNLTQSIYVREKGYGMGKYAQKMSSLFHNRGRQELVLAGTPFVANAANLKNFRVWWSKICWEHFIVFWLIGIITILLLTLLSYASVFGLAGNSQGINFLINEAGAIGGNILPIAGTLFIFMAAVMLFQTQLGIMDSSSRIMAENAALIESVEPGRSRINLSKIYYLFVWLQIGFGVMLFMFDYYEPKTLIVFGAVINAVAMFVHIGLTTYLNRRALPKAYRPALWRKILLWFIFAFFGVFSVITLISQWSKLFG